jgi:hypothetical protein
LPSPVLLAAVRPVVTVLHLAEDIRAVLRTADAHVVAELYARVT